MVDGISAAEPRPLLRFRRIVVMGGGCYGSWYTQQLTRAIHREALVAHEIIVVDRDPHCQVAERLGEGAYDGAPVHVAVRAWDDYVADWLAAGPEALAEDAMVPSPLMPHVCLDWLMARARAHWPGRTVGIAPLPVAPPTPWERAAPDGRHYVSFATWTCPVNCIEPARCPATRGPRDWSMPVALGQYVDGLVGQLDGACIFPCEHRTYGVGMIDAARIAAAEAQVVGSGALPRRLLVGTVSHCHGALGVLTIT